MPIGRGAGTRFPKPSQRRDRKREDGAGRVDWGEVFQSTHRPSVGAGSETGRECAGIVQNRVDPGESYGLVLYRDLRARGKGGSYAVGEERFARIGSAVGGG